MATPRMKCGRDPRVTSLAIDQRSQGPISFSTSFQILHRLYGRLDASGGALIQTLAAAGNPQAPQTLEFAKVDGGNDPHTIGFGESR